MAVDNVPWMVPGNVEHSTNIARVLAYAAFGGDEGIIGPRDLEVRELAVPAGQVRVYPGACAILNDAPNIKYEAYAARVVSETTVDIAPTGSGDTGGRTDLVIARVVNPWETTEDTEPAAGAEQDYAYFRIEVVQNIGSQTERDALANLGYSAIPLAKVTIPGPSTGTITQDMIRDVRQMTQVRRSEYFNVIAPTTSKELTASSFVNLHPDVYMDIEVPEWATHMEVRAILGGVKYGGSGNNGGAGWNLFGDLRIQLAAGSVVQYGQNTTFNLSNDVGKDATTLIAGAPAMPLGANFRGENTSIRVEGRKRGGNGGQLWVDQHAMTSLEVRFYQHPESNL